jgi:maltose alpha-D-glucosyltransferase/alpha-amylase
VANLSRQVQCVELDLSKFKGMVPVEMFGRTRFPPVGEQPYFLTLGSYAFYWFLLEAPRPAALPAPPSATGLPTLRVGRRWDNILRGKVVQELEGLLPLYLRSCRWLVPGSRDIKAARVRGSVPVPAKGGGAQLVLVDVEWLEGDTTTYVLPLAFAGAERAAQVQASRPEAVIARLQLQRPIEGDGLLEEGVLYDPLAEGSFAEAIVDLIARRRRPRDEAAELVGWAALAFPDIAGPEGGLPPPTLVRDDPYRTLVVLGERGILKLSRRFEPGINPELEMVRFLTERAGFAHTPPLGGALEYRSAQGETATVAVLKAFVPNRGNAWRYTHDDLGRYFERALARPEKPQDFLAPHRSLLDLLGDVPALAGEVIGSYLESARLLGLRTGEMHVALASARDDPEFAPEPSTALDQRSLYQTVRSQTRQAFELLKKRQRALPESARADAVAVLGREEEVLRRAGVILQRKINAQRLRCHGDYHLAVVLYTGKDFVVTNFEGNPVRPLSDRRRKRSPLRDVAAMLRSFHYVVLTALSGGQVRPEDVPAVTPWVRFWHRWVSVVFLKAYLEVAVQSTFLPKAPEEQRALLDFYLLKRAVSELHYELEHHPDRVPIPLRGLLELLEDTG